MTFIADIDPNTPAGTDNVSDGDNQIRQFKSDVLDSFPSITGAVTVDHLQLNSVINRLASFNGRTDILAVPVSGDYELADANGVGLGDVDINSPADGETLKYNFGTGNWENVASALSGAALYSTDAVAAPSVNSLYCYFTTEESNSIPAALGEVFNSAVNGLEFVAAADCVVTFDYSMYTTVSAANDFAIVLNGAGSTLPFSQSNSAIVSRANLGNSVQANISGTCLCASSDRVAINNRFFNRVTAADGILRITVRGV